MGAVSIPTSDLAGTPPDRSAASAGIEGVTVALQLLAGTLQSLWSAALGHAESYEIARLIQASHAVQRAVMALRDDTVIGA